MFTELTSDNVIDISMFIKDQGIGLIKDCKYAVNSFYSAKQYQVRLLRKAFFDETLIAYGNFEDDDITDLVLFDIKRDDHQNFVTVTIFNLDNAELLKYAVEKIFEDNSNVLKVKLSTTDKYLSSGYEQKLLDIGFEKELCNREFEDTEKCIYTYSLFK